MSINLQHPKTAEPHALLRGSERVARVRVKAHGFVIAGTSPDGKLVELIELRDHPWFLACQYHPEFQSKPNAPHPLFKGFIQACLAHDA